MKTVMNDCQLIAEMRELLTEYMTEFPAFRSKPEGSPGSDARKEQEADIRREDRTLAVLALQPGFQSTSLPVKDGG